MNNEILWKRAISVLLILAAVMSFALVGKKMAQPETYGSLNATLDEKEKDVLKLVGTTGVVSAAITLLPDDLATPIAEKVADLGGYLLLVLCAVYAERYLLTITGFAAWKLLFPIACVLLAVHIWKPAPALKQIAAKLLVLGFAIVLVIPVSLKTGELIESTYAESINETIASAENATNEVANVKEFKSEVVNVVNRFMRVVAMYIVVTCIFPILVLLFFVHLINTILGTDFRPAIYRGHRAPKEA